MKPSLPFFISFISLCVMIAGCGPSLKKEEEFKPKRVRMAIFDDECKLQSFFDGYKEKLKPFSEQSISAETKLAWGEAIFKLKDKALDAFIAMLHRVYRRFDVPRKKKLIEVKVYFHQLAGKKQVPIGAKMVIVDGDDEEEFPYHPCIGAFFYGQEKYQVRSKLIK